VTCVSIMLMQRA